MNFDYCLKILDNIQKISNEGDFDKIKNLFDEIEKTNEYKENKIFQIIILKEKASACARKGDNDACSEHIIKGMNELDAIDINNLNISNKLFFSKFSECESAFISLLGRLEYYGGNIDIAMNKFQQALQIRQKHNDKGNIASSFNQIGIVYYAKGELEEALTYFDKSLKLLIQVDNIREIAYTYNNMANIYADLGKAEIALQKYNNSLIYLEKVGFPLDIVAALENICILMLECKLDGVIYYLNKLEKIFDEDPNNKHLELSYKYTRAVYLKTTSIRVSGKIEAQNIFKYIIYKLDIDTEITIPSIKHYISLLLIEYKNYGEQDVLDEISEILNKLHQIGQEQQSYRIIVETLLLQAQFEMLMTGNHRKARQLLNQAEITSEEKNLVSLSILVSTTYDKMLEQDIFPRGIYISDISSTINLLSKSDFSDELGLSDEKPLIFLIIERNKTCIYSKSFKENTNEEKTNLIANYIIALDIFNQEAFSTSGSLERIKHEDHTIIIRNFNDNMFCYAFKGPSYQASKKLDALLKKLLKGKLMLGLNLKKSLNNEQIKYIDELLDEIILQN